MILRVGQLTFAGDDAAEVVASAIRAQYGPGVDGWPSEPPLLADLKNWALAQLNTWRGARRAELGLTSAVFQELVYTGKVLECQRWLADPESNFGLALEAVARGLSNQDMALLVLVQWSAWAGGSDAIEAGYIAARAAVEAATSEAEVAGVLAGLE